MTNIHRVVRLLEDTLRLIAHPAHWVQQAFATTGDGIPTASLHPRASCFCLIGALDRKAQSRRDFDVAIDMLAEFITRGPNDANASTYSLVMFFNDAEGRTHREVVTLLQNALAKAKASLNLQPKPA